MKKSKIYSMDYRRKREGKTHYKKRLRILISDKPRLVIRKSLKNIQANIVSYDAKGDKILLSAHSRELQKLGWKLNRGNLSSAYLVGLLLGKKAKEKGIKSVVLDLGLIKSIKGCRSYAVLSGVIDGGLEVPHNTKILPTKDRVSGKHMEEYAIKLKNDEVAYKKQFGAYLKNNIYPEKFVDYFNKMKNNIEDKNDGK